MPCAKHLTATQLLRVALIYPISPRGEGGGGRPIFFPSGPLPPAGSAPDVPTRASLLEFAAPVITARWWGAEALWAAVGPSAAPGVYKRPPLPLMRSAFEQDIEAYLHLWSSFGENVYRLVMQVSRYGVTWVSCAVILQAKVFTFCSSENSGFFSTSPCPANLAIVCLAESYIPHSIYIIYLFRYEAGEPLDKAVSRAPLAAWYFQQTPGTQSQYQQCGV